MATIATLSTQACKIFAARQIRLGSERSQLLASLSRELFSADFDGACRALHAVADDGYLQLWAHGEGGIRDAELLWCGGEHDRHGLYVYDEYERGTWTNRPATTDWFAAQTLETLSEIHAAIARKLTDFCRAAHTSDFEAAQ